MKKLLWLLLLIPIIAACGKPADPAGTDSTSDDIITEPAVHDIILYDCRGGSPKEETWSATAEDLTPDNLVKQLSTLLGLSLSDAEITSVKIESNRIIISFNGVHPVYTTSDSTYADAIYDSFAKTFRHNYGDEKSVYFTIGDAPISEPYIYSWDRGKTPAETTAPIEEGSLSQADAIEYALNLAVDALGDNLGLHAEADGTTTVEGIRCYVIKVYQPGMEMPVRQFAIGLNNERVYQFSYYQQKYIPY